MHILEDEISARMVRDALHYDPETGVFTWREDRPLHHFKNEHGRNIWRSRWGGQIAGRVKSNGYWRIDLFGKQYLAHRLAFIYMNGFIPSEEEVDHLNGIRDDNRWDNLRLVNKGINSRNKGMTSLNKSGITGVCWSNDKGKWRAFGRKEGKAVHLGYFALKEEARAAREEWLSSQEDYTISHGRRRMNVKRTN